jgi:hypothetical protein
MSRSASEGTLPVKTLCGHNWIVCVINFAMEQRTARIDIDALSEEELIELNHKIIS